VTGSNRYGNTIHERNNNKGNNTNNRQTQFAEWWEKTTIYSYGGTGKQGDKREIMGWMDGWIVV